MMAIRLCAALAAALMFAASAFAAGASDLEWAIRYRVVGLTELSQDYELLIYRDGRVRYLGGNAVKVRGEASKQVSKESVETLLRQIESSGFFEFRELYVRDKPPHVDVPAYALRPKDADKARVERRSVTIPPSVQIGETDLIWIFEVRSGARRKVVIHDNLRESRIEEAGRFLQCAAARIEQLAGIEEWTGRLSLHHSAQEYCKKK